MPELDNLLPEQLPLTVLTLQKPGSIVLSWYKMYLLRYFGYQSSAGVHCNNWRFSVKFWQPYKLLHLRLGCELNLLRQQCHFMCSFTCFHNSLVVQHWNQTVFFIKDTVA